MKRVAFGSFIAKAFFETPYRRLQLTVSDGHRYVVIMTVKYDCEVEGVRPPLNFQCGKIIVDAFENSSILLLSLHTGSFEIVKMGYCKLYTWLKNSNVKHKSSL